MSFQEQPVANTSSTRRGIFVIIGLLTALLVAGLVYLLNRPAATPDGPPRLAGALRPGTPEFDQLRDRIFVTDPEATEATRAIGDVVMELTSTVSNFTGRTITGLEMRGAVIDTDGQPIKERTIIIIPGRQTQLEPNKSIQARIMLDRISKTAVRANIKVEVTGVKFE